MHPPLSSELRALGKYAKGLAQGLLRRKSSTKASPVHFASAEAEKPDGGLGQAKPLWSGSTQTGPASRLPCGLQSFAPVDAWFSQPVNLTWVTGKGGKLAELKEAALHRLLDQTSFEKLPPGLTEKVGFSTLTQRRGSATGRETESP